MVLKEYESASRWKKLVWHFPTFLTAFCFCGAVYLAGTYKQALSSASQAKLKEPEFVPVYDEGGKLVGMTHPVLVAATEKKRGAYVAK